MSLWAIIPVKPLYRAKSRLADVLSPEQRYRFAETMLRHMLTILQNAPQVTGTLVISRDTKALSIARDLGAKTIQESNPSDLNPALSRATEVARVWGAGAVLILPADLPFITVEDVENIAEMGINALTVVLTPDYEEDGTNAMLIRPAGLIAYSYGEKSFERHVTSAKLAGADVKFYESDNLRLDIDVPADLIEYNRLVQDGHSDFLPQFFPDAIS
ncbi:MAG: 2-phospho-L-lactate guanylyltransferase [Anaerolineae bacterium]|nr:2-phospho-L-lactate guanylyltransferase [Anaerolineae bacterium]MDQ7034169.1 2-phospho-L-lactate guanylyltransferase [Anaerolineae bacterium]